MDQILLTQLDRLEAALTTLTESISDYNPSVPAAHALLAADEDLQRGLKQLHTHQCNQLKIQQLRDVIEAQNAQITSHLQLLADTRADLLSIPTSLPERGRREVEYGELLEYAKYVGQYTMPPNFRPSMVESAGEEVGMVGVEGEGAIAQQQQQQQSGESKVLEDILRNEKQYLDASTGIQFTPWPSEDVIKRGALARIQGMMERGRILKVEVDWAVTRWKLRKKRGRPRRASRLLAPLSSLVLKGRLHDEKRKRRKSLGVWICMTRMKNEDDDQVL